MWEFDSIRQVWIGLLGVVGLVELFGLSVIGMGYGNGGTDGDDWGHERVALVCNGD